MLATALAETPALPLHEAGKYVAGAYVVLFALVLIYVAIMSIRLSHIEAELGELLSMTEPDGAPGSAAAPAGAPAHGDQRGPGGAPAADGSGGPDAAPESTPAYPIKGHP